MTHIFVINTTALADYCDNYACLWWLSNNIRKLTDSRITNFKNPGTILIVQPPTTVYTQVLGGINVISLTADVINTIETRNKIKSNHVALSLPATGIWRTPQPFVNRILCIHTHYVKRPAVHSHRGPRGMLAVYIDGNLVPCLHKTVWVSAR